MIYCITKSKHGKDDSTVPGLMGVVFPRKQDLNNVKPTQSLYLTHSPCLIHPTCTHFSSWFPSLLTSFSQLYSIFWGIL